MTTLSLYRGIAVPAASVENVTSSIRRDGLIQGQGTWTIEQVWKLPAGVSTEKPELIIEETRQADWRPAICACGTLEGAEYYAWQHNRFGAQSTPLLIEFEADLDQVRIDGRDFLYTAFQMGDPEKAQSVLENVYGNKIMKYADPAWASHKQEERIALGHLATFDPDVILAHYANRTVIGGRYGTIFQSAFTVASPVQPKDISRVWAPEKRGALRAPSVTVDDILPTQPSEPPESHRKEVPTPRVSLHDIWRFKHRD